MLVAQTSPSMGPGGSPASALGVSLAPCPEVGATPGTHLRQEGVYVTGLEPQLCVGHRVCGVAPPLHFCKVVLRHIAFRQVKPVDERQDVPGKRAGLTAQMGACPMGSSEARRGTYVLKQLS